MDNLKIETKRNKNDYVIIYKQPDGLFRIYDLYDKSIKSDKFPNHRYHYFKLKHDNYPTTDKGLKRYAKDFKSWANELKEATYNEKRNKSLIDYTEAISDFSNTTRLFQYFCKKNYKDHQDITLTEYNWMEKAPKSGQQYLKEKNVKVESYGYDYNKYYGRILGSKDYLIPTEAGQEVKIKMLNDNLEHGYYHCKITCDNDDFRKMFTFSKYDVYLNISIDFARKHQEEFNVNIELVVDKKPNALLYKKCDLVSLNSITHEWFDYVMELNKKFPKNKLLKFMISSCWGQMSQTNIINRTEEQIIKENLDIGHPKDHEYDIINEIITKNSHYYEIINSWTPYKYNIRLKPYISVYGMVNMARLSYPVLKHVVRVHTDCIVTDIQVEYDDENILSEDKTTGLIHWNNNNSYCKVDDPEYDEWLIKNKLT